MTRTENGGGGYVLIFVWYISKDKLSKNVNTKPKRSRLKADFLWEEGGDGSLATKNSLFPH
jgi:hypothetical protein